MNNNVIGYKITLTLMKWVVLIVKTKYLKKIHITKLNLELKF